jgi:hypothetical protein
MNKAERYVRSAINRAASEGLYEIPIEKTLIPRELALKLINEGYRISEWKDNLVISWDILGRG